MVSVSFTISDELKTKMEKFSWINWSDVAREEAIKQEKRAELFKELEELTKDSTLTDKDCLKLGKLVNKRILERLQKED
jgi:hypothetical protein